MKKWEQITFISVMMTLGFANVTHSSFEGRPVSARSAAMGKSFLAASNEPSSVFTNPAGSADLSRPEIGFSYERPQAGISELGFSRGHVAAVVPSKWGALGLGYAAFQAPGLLEEKTLALSYGRSFQRFQVGVTGKMLSHSYAVGGAASSDPVFRNGTAARAISFDAGIMVSLTRYLKAGFAVRNGNEPNVGLASEDRVKREIQSGLLFDMPGMGLKATGDFLLRRQRKDEATSKGEPMFGLEKRVGKTLALRAGYALDEISGGFGLRLGNWGMDYSMGIQTQVGGANAGSHLIGMSYRFSRRREEMATAPGRDEPSRAKEKSAPEAVDSMSTSGTKRFESYSPAVKLKATPEQQTRFSDGWNWFRYRQRDGAPTQELIDILTRLILKYESVDIDLILPKDALEMLRRSSEAQSAPGRRNSP